jgi:hypothetical protein
MELKRFLPPPRSSLASLHIRHLLERGGPGYQLLEALKSLKQNQF